ncbi:conserved hypothetical protein [Methylocella silvestris BL2]|uniref:Uncharacterized protein n=1 Tax=Methylocella silvestris (strain DSM 15510 / CIP 108128 / LMG 27833 / NCIMB 13906 / BL2) TaxID=395965 RepID=B8ES05_METSB|nr:hypothetical protein [Methylocella silvestris]ACK51703.1 conserved hypothetical protein [Methylocella silvestris BL2]
MAEVTYYVALPFIRTDDGDLVPGEAKEFQSAGAAVSEAQRMAFKAAGAVAFSRSGDPALGEFQDAVVIQRFGDVPDVDALLGVR